MTTPEASLIQANAAGQASNLSGPTDLETALLTAAGAASLSGVPTDNCFEFCAALAWSDAALDLWRRQQKATWRARSRYLLGPIPGDPDQPDDPRALLSPDLDATITPALRTKLAR